MNFCVLGARGSLSASVSEWSFRLAFGLSALLSIGAQAARADDVDIYVYASQYDGSTWAIEGWVFADDPEGLPVVLTGIPGISSVTAYTDETGYFLYLVDGVAWDASNVVATVTDDDGDTASSNYYVD